MSNIRTKTKNIRTKTKGYLSVFLAVLILVLCAPVSFGTIGSFVYISGSCGAQGNNVSWELKTDGVLTIFGSGDMANYTSQSTPWYKYGVVNYIKSVEIGSGVTSIGESAFSLCTQLENVTISNGVTSSVTSIGNSAFSSCVRLKSIKIPSSVTNIGGSAFFGCIALQSFTVEPDNPAYASDAFGCLFNKEKTELIQYPYGNPRTAYTIPDSVTVIGSYAFGISYYYYVGHSYSSVLQSITIPDGVTSIGEGAFYSCSALQSITIPDSVTSIGDKAFYSCSALQSITIPDSVTSIGDEAFLSCSALQSITIPDSVTSIGCRTFAGCSAQGITIPDSVTNIGDRAFEGCAALQSITVDSDNPYYISDAHGCLFNKEKTRLMQYPLGNTRTSYSIPSSVTSIDECAFAGCAALQSVTIPSSVTSIGYSAFDYRCSALADVYYGGSPSQWSDISIHSTNKERFKSVTIHYFTHIHTYVGIVTTPATCTKEGNSTYWSCPGCGKAFADANGENEIPRTSWVLPIDPTNHGNTIDIPAVASTCTVKGYTAGVYCNDCKKYISGHAEQPLAAHTSTIINAREATYDAEGYTGDTYCTVCKQTLSYGTSIPKLTKSEEPTNPTTKPTDEKPTENLNFFQRIIQWFRNLFARLFGR